MINSCIFRPVPPTSRQTPSIRLRCRDFTFVAFHFNSEGQARDVYDTIRSLTCKLGKIEKLYAFTYIPQAPESKINGWELYNPEKEFARLGIGPKASECGWRISRINIDYKVRAILLLLMYAHLPFSLLSSIRLLILRCSLCHPRSQTTFLTMRGVFGQEPEYQLLYTVTP
jgi:hypothetical protein